MKKVYGAIVLLILLFSGALFLGIGLVNNSQSYQIKNIFDEIYQETQKTYRGKNILEEIPDFSIRSSWPSDAPNIAMTPFGRYLEAGQPDTYSVIRIGFNFESDRKTLSVSFRKNLSHNINLSIWGMYNSVDKTLTKTMHIAKRENGTERLIEDDTEIKAYLDEYGITVTDLNSYYNTIVNQKVLKDWCSIYDSAYSPEDYGQVTVKTQWEKW